MFYQAKYAASRKRNICCYLFIQPVNEQGLKKSDDFSTDY